MHKRIVIKIGTGVLSKANGLVDEAVILSIVEQIAALKKKGVEIILVSSGAVGFGRGLLKIDQSKETVADKQVFAAVGQVKLMEIYARFFEQKNYRCAQVLVTKSDFRDRNHYQNMRRCFLNLLRDGIVPIVNENDVIAIKELVFTDNDELAGLVAAQLEADAVIILTSVDGVLDDQNKVIPEIDLEVINEAQKHITKEKTAVGRGGMATKFAIAKKLISSGIAVHIASGRQKNILLEIVNNQAVGTKFIAAKKTSGVKRRLAYSDGLAMGAIVVNECASKMLIAKEKAMSILPIGVTKIIGEFEKGDVVEIKDLENQKIGFGVIAANSEIAKTQIGKKGGKALVHYDYMFIE